MKVREISEKKPISIKSIGGVSFLLIVGIVLLLIAFQLISHTESSIDPFYGMYIILPIGVVFTVLAVLGGIVVLIRSFQLIAGYFKTGLNIYNSCILRYWGRLSGGGSTTLRALDLPELSSLGDAKPLLQTRTTINIEEFWKQSVAQLRLCFLEMNTDYLIEFDFLIPRGYSNTIHFFIGSSEVGTMTVPESYDEDWKQYSRYILLSTGDNFIFNIFFVPEDGCIVLLRNVSWGVIE